ncbi:MAG: hypothetical protein K8R31_04430 [Bacteroidales bacterium]|nr:hypothetical protein [Bacteroidales bacterium]
MNKLVLEKLDGENIVGVIPINPKGLNIKFANKSLTPNFWQILLMFLISLPITILVLAMLSFILADLFLNGSTVSLVLVPIFLVILAMPTYLIYRIYVNKIKKYPETIFVITKQNFYFFLLENNIVKVHHKFDVPFDKLSKVFYGEINRKTNVLGRNFEIRQNNKKIIKGKLKIVNNSFINSTIDSEFLLPIKELQYIYLQ